MNESLGESGMSVIPETEIEEAIRQSPGFIVPILVIVAMDEPKTPLFISIDAVESDKALKRFHEDKPGKAFCEIRCTGKLATEVLSVPASVLTAG
jgi:hypothetical protein